MRARGAAAGQHAVIAVQHRDTTTLRPLRSDALIAGVVELIGDAPTSRGAWANVRAAALDAAAGAAEGDWSGLVERGERPADAYGVARMCRGAHTRGQFVVQVAARDGRRHLAPHVVAFHDTPAGRHLQLRRGDAKAACRSVRVAGELLRHVRDTAGAQWGSEAFDRCAAQVVAEIGTTASLLVPAPDERRTST